MGLFSREASSKEGVIDAVLTPQQEFRVRVGGVFWHALGPTGIKFSPGETIQIVGRRQNKLFIIPL